MCGIAGFIGFENNIDLANQANIIQRHRGPDHQATWSDEHISMAHQRLAIIDLEGRANQPFMKKEYIIVYNGELYNYQEIKKSNLKDIQFNTSSDTEVVLEMYIKYKEDCLIYFKGMFSFVIYNTDTKELFGARDHFGIKPFFYYSNFKRFAFSSELKTLTSIKSIKKEINQKSLISSINYVWIPGNETMINDINKLPPSHYFRRTSKGDFVIKKYWELETNPIQESEKYFEEKLDHLLNQSIKRHMVSDVPVGSFLSGGLDSSLISVMALENTDSLSTYTIATDSQDKKIEKMPSDEKYASSLAAQFGFKHNEINIKPDILKDLPFIVRALDEPIGDPAAINTYLISKAARSNGIKVLMSGMGADEIFFGYRRMKAIMLAEQFKKLPGPIRQLTKAVVNQLPVRVQNRGIRFSRWSKKFLSFAELQSSEAYRMSYSYYNPGQLSGLLNIPSSEIMNEIIADHDSIFNKHYENDIINKMCYTDVHMFMNGLNLTYTDRSSMAASVEVRVPFIDKELMSFAMQIPGQLKYKNRESKAILKKVAEKYLPKDIIYRPKASFGVPLRSWISGDLKNMVDDLLSEKVVRDRGVFNYKNIKYLIDSDRIGNFDYSYQIYQLLTIELWFREFVD